MVSNFTGNALAKQKINQKLFIARFLTGLNIKTKSSERRIRRKILVPEQEHFWCPRSRSRKLAPDPICRIINIQKWKQMDFNFQHIIIDFAVKIGQDILKK
jgi:hypothetical protein